MKRTPHRIRIDRRGGALLEFALCAPILLYLLLAVFDFSRYYVEASQLGQVAWNAAYRAASAPQADLAAPASIEVELQTFCECPYEPDSRFACGERSCAAYGDPARYSQATARKPFSFLGRYPGFPRNVQIRRTAGVRAE